MKILITGSSGFVGSELRRALSREGHTIARLVRPGAATAGCDVRWNPISGEIDSAAMEAADAVVNLAGASIGEGRWSEPRKQVLRTSRVDATRSLVAALSRLQRPPQVLVSASAVGYYGDRGDEPLTESSPPGDDFLARLARDWEEAARAAEAFGIRTVVLRFGVILAAHGGALQRMLRPFKMGLGGRLGSGRQWISWLTVDEAVGLIRHVLGNTQLRGTVNTVAPHPVQNAEFAHVLARVLHRPALFPTPSFALRLLLGEMAEALLLSSQRVIPEVLTVSGYPFLHPTLEPALRAALGRQR